MNPILSTNIYDIYFGISNSLTLSTILHEPVGDNNSLGDLSLYIYTRLPRSVRLSDHSFSNTRERFFKHKREKKDLMFSPHDGTLCSKKRDHMKVFGESFHGSFKRSKQGDQKQTKFEKNTTTLFFQRSKSDSAMLIKPDVQLHLEAKV